MRDRIKKTSLLELVTTVDQAAASIHDGMTVAMSGYAMAGYPKGIVQELITRKQNGETLSISLITGANVPWLDEKLSGENIISRRVPMCASRSLASQINGGSVRYVEQQMNKMPRLLRSNSFGKIDIAIIEALGINENGDLIPTTSVGLAHHLIQAADQVIIEINMAQTEKLMGLHDVYIPQAPPHSQPIPLTYANQRIGTVSIPINTDKIKYIVETNIPERSGPQALCTAETNGIVSNLFNFLELESKRNFGGALPPIQTGFGGIANGIANAFHQSNFKDLQFFCGGIGVSVMELLVSGKAAGISTAGLEMSERMEEIINNTPNLRDSLVIRNGDIANNAEIIGRLSLLALNTGIEMDIYGNVNGSHISGSRVVNGIGGGANFAQNSGLSIILIPSTGKSGQVSNVVPMVSHQDICEHDVDVIVTENGVADLRGLDEIERAEQIIAHCTAGEYQEQLTAYLHEARKKCGGHHPQLPEAAFAWYQRLRDTGSMLGRNE